MIEEENTPVVTKAQEPRRRKKGGQNVPDGPKIIMDLQWGEFMNEHTKKKLVSQCATSYSHSKQAALSPKLIFTSFQNDWPSLFERNMASKWSNNIVEFTEQSLTERFAKEDIVYLTADTDNVCTKLDPTKCYAIGCLIDHNSKKNLTYDYAVKNGLRMERLPIQEYIKMEGRKVLTVNAVVEILVRFINGETWGDSLCHSIASRKKPVIIKHDEETTEKKEETNVDKESEKA